MKKSSVTKILIAAFALSAAFLASGCSNPAAGNLGGGDNKTELGLAGYYNWQGSPYTISNATATGVNISYNGSAPVQYTSGTGCDITFGTTTKVTLKVKNNKAANAYVKVDVKNDSASAVTAATANGSTQDVQYGGCGVTIPANGEVEFVLTIDPSKNATKFIIGLNNDQATNPTDGDITITEAYMFK